MSLKDVPTLPGSFGCLRPLVPEDAPSLRAYADDEAVWRNLFDGFPRPYTLADAQWWCGERPDDLGYVWGIDVDGQIVGCISVRPESGWLRCNAEVGYWIGQPFWRRGMTSEALGLVTAWAWRNLPRSAIKNGQVIDRVQWACLRPVPGSDASR